MQHYRRRADPVEAVQLTDDADWVAIARWCGSSHAAYPHEPGDLRDQIYVPTPWGGDWANVDEWIIKRADGSFDVLKPGHFEVQYELDEES